ncbi:energy-coupling factor transporter transmembrane component T [Paenibacillus sp. FSL K6-3166]|uniref:energy-coupling factor transporter transmembrane component T family protein n=1 Tax=unclassified Paenibacillus TaxID=185978 RepID=UPI000B9FF741|nr:energy-coupling factor transporter transmembrane component T [Paenibacillus sp. VTT E-133291]OZQ97307.1 cobalt transporter [Paenibacillus sp. VTT E-133291]
MEAVKRALDRISVEQIKLELLGTAYNSSGTFLGRLDPRTLLLWYLFFAIVPWFVHNRTVLLGMFVLMVLTTVLSRVSPYIIFILCLGLISQIGWMFILSLFFGGGIESLLPMLTLTLKLSVISLASITVFSSLDPERLSDGLLSLGIPDTFAFSLSYGYRILPTLLEEFHQILLSFRLRGQRPLQHGLLYWRTATYYLRIVILAFYPLMLNTAKRSRTTIEALETRGFSYGLNNKKVKKIKLSYLKMKRSDWYFLSGSTVYVILLFWIGYLYPKLVY